MGFVIGAGWRWNRLAVLGLLCAAGTAILSAPVPAAEGEGRLVACAEGSWSQWRGPRRDGVSDEKGLLQSWPEGGPKLLWTAGELGQGYSSPVFGDGRIFISGEFGQQLVVMALSMNGAVQWKTPNGKSWKNPFPGSRACCLYEGGRVYNMNAYGRTVCLDAATGKELWAVEVLQRFEAKQPQYGMPECLLIDGPRLIITPGGRKGLLAALDKQTGQALWASDLVAQGNEMAGYSSPILIEYGGRRQVIAIDSDRTFAADAETGKVLWSVPLRFTKNTTNTIPVFWRDSVYITNTARDECDFYRLKLDPANAAPTKAWVTTELSVSSGSALCAEGRLYAAGRLKIKGWVCMDAETGKVRYLKGDPTIGSAAFADGRLYCLNENGTMLLVNPAAEAFETVGQFDLVKGKKDVWAHPVICTGRLYLRYHQNLYCYDIRR